MAALLLNASGATNNFTNNNQFQQQLQQTTIDIQNNNTTTNIGYEALLMAFAKLPSNPYANLFNNNLESVSAAVTPQLKVEKLTANLSQNLLSPIKINKSYNFGIPSTANNKGIVPGANKVTEATSPPPAKRACLQEKKNDFLPTTTNCAQLLQTAATTPINNNIR